MWLYYLLKTISTLVSWLPYKLVVNIGIGIGHLYHTIAKKQRIRAEETIKERLGYSDEEALSLGVYKTYTEENLRYSQNAPLNMYDEVNTKCNLPAQIDLSLIHISEPTRP